MHQALQDEGRYDDIRRIEDLRDPHQEHTWLYALNPATEPVMPAQDWVRAMRIRLGCDHMGAEMVCAACGTHVLDRQAYHALCYANGESTRGHNRVRNELLTGFSAADPTSAAEVEGLVPSQPRLRPADILTGAAHPTLGVAVDVMVKAPNAGGAGQDCTETGKREKMERYGPVLHELRDQGIIYKPAVFSAYGRCHPDVTDMMTEAARRVARHRGFADWKPLFTRWRRQVAVQVWRRAAAMVTRCLTRDDREAAERLLAGEGTRLEPDLDQGAPPTATGPLITRWSDN